MSFVSLCDLKKGDGLVIKELKTGEKLRQRLLDIGFVPGTKVKCVCISPFGSPKGLMRTHFTFVPGTKPISISLCRKLPDISIFFITKESPFLSSLSEKYCIDIPPQNFSGWARYQNMKKDRKKAEFTEN